MLTKLNQHYSNERYCNLDFNTILAGCWDSVILLWPIFFLWTNRSVCIYIIGYILAGINKIQKMKVINIYLNELDDTIKDWMIKETTSKISNRYKQIHVAEDIGVNTTQLWRFMNNKKVSEDFYIKWFKWYSKNQ
jgi:hypothetical protein